MTTIRRRLLAVLLALVVLTGATAGAIWAGVIGGGPPLADRLRDAVSVRAILDDLATLQRITRDSGGIRAGGTSGQLRAADFVAAELSRMGYQVEIDTFQLPTFREVGANLVTTSTLRFHSGVDFRPMIFSAAADLRGRLVAVDFDPDASLTDQPRGVGCSSSDFSGVPTGAVLLVQGGGCFARQIVDNATAAGASGLILTYPGWETNAIRRPTLRTPDVTIPVIGASREMGLALNEVAEAGQAVRLAIRVETIMRPSANVIAETPGGDPDHVVMLGGHLDGVIDGPGINDNGSGTMTILEIARRVIEMDPARKVRLAFWTGEEIGLYGSFRYVEQRSGARLEAIDLYLNFDMLGSPNGGRIVYADEQDASGSDGITAQFEAYFEDAGLTYTTEDLGGASDHFPFQQRGVPTGGLFSGASELVDEHAAQLFGTEAGLPADACYHLACDRTDNVDARLLEEMARAAAHVTGLYASGAQTARE